MANNIMLKKCELFKLFSLLYSDTFGKFLSVCEIGIET